ncbi:nucleotide pyrophosphohydrolase, partial [Patescibacteria group bacterium]
MNKIIEKIKAFNKSRGWSPTPQDCAKSIIIEGAELLEHFQWDDSDKDDSEIDISKKNWGEIELEIADVFWYVVA